VTPWSRILVVLLGGCQLMMAARAEPVTTVVGALSGVALVAAALVPHRQRRASATLVLLGTVPFAAVAWSALVPLLVMLVALALAAPLLRTRAVGPFTPHA